ncbi:DUF4920 domain-containing protein [Nonlabens antarcticus]|uniref:DUF4920 domain-containing protein n=1 Tax=Nonlabens antarcticus TaxID=392714 RepID=UPI001891E87B|nr:DUF4920 domain-containing protein [Nonlabens antarcticus]
MKHLFAVILMTLSLISCRNTTDTDETPALNEEQLEEVAYLSYGNDIKAEKAISSEELAELYANLKPNDTLNVKVKSSINEVCTNKGCWIKIPAGSESARVTFKDYGFFLPKNSQGKEVVLEGRAFKSVTSIEDLKHFAMDGGKSKEEIDGITKEEVTLSFEATGALVESFENPDVFEVAPAKTSE